MQDADTPKTEERANASIEGGRGEIHQVAEKHTRMHTLTHSHTHAQSHTHTQLHPKALYDQTTSWDASKNIYVEARDRQTELKTWPVWIVLMSTPKYTQHGTLIKVRGMLLKNSAWNSTQATSRDSPVRPGTANYELVGGQSNWVYESN